MQCESPLVSWGRACTAEKRRPRCLIVTEYPHGWTRQFSSIEAGRVIVTCDRGIGRGGVAVTQPEIEYCVPEQSG